MAADELDDLQTKRTSIVIRTLPLGTGNYGGILQAFALQRVIRELGASPVIDVSRADDRGAGLRARSKLFAKRLLMSVGYTRPAWTRVATRETVDAALRDFVEKRIDTVRLYSAPGRPDWAIVRAAGAFVVGSDQVWRRRYGDVRSYLLDFLAADDSRPRIAYAASFGRDDLDEYEPELKAESARLARRFDAISVRESSGIRLARELFGVDAVHHFDPTLLLQPAEYTKLAAEAHDPLPAGRLLDYVLDDEPPVRAAVAAVAAALGEEPMSLLPPSPPSLRASRLHPDRYRKPSIEAWLGAIATARFVVTDSFHGTVFAILNNVPFIAVVNRSRGAARFESLLDTLQLRDRLVEPGAADLADLVFTPIDWLAVNGQIDQERQRAVDYLRCALASVL